jgi:hypothetical protein
VGGAEVAGGGRRVAEGLLDRGEELQAAGHAGPVVEVAADGHALGQQRPSPRRVAGAQGGGGQAGQGCDDALPVAQVAQGRDEEARRVLARDLARPWGMDRRRRPGVPHGDLAGHRPPLAQLLEGQFQVIG